MPVWQPTPQISRDINAPTRPFLRMRNFQVQHCHCRYSCVVGCIRRSPSCRAGGIACISLGLLCVDFLPDPSLSARSTPKIRCASRQNPQHGFRGRPLAVRVPGNAGTPILNAHLPSVPSSVRSALFVQSLIIRARSRRISNQARPCKYCPIESSASREPTRRSQIGCRYGAQHMIHSGGTGTRG